MNDLPLLELLLANPTSLADEFGLPVPAVATDDDPDDSPEPREQVRGGVPRRVRTGLPRGVCLCGDE